MHTAVSSLLPPLLLLVLHSPVAASQSLSPKQQAAFSDAANHIEALHTNPGFSAFREDVNTRLEQFLSTQTIQADAQNTDQPDAPLQFALVEIEHEWAQTQTFITGAAKETVVNAINQFLDTGETRSGGLGGGGGGGGGIRRVVTMASSSPLSSKECNSQNPPPPARPATRTTVEAIPSDVMAAVDEKDEAPSPAAARETNGVRLEEDPAAAAADDGYDSEEYGPEL